MNQPVSVPNDTDLDNFIEFLFDGIEGYAYLVAKAPDNKAEWNQQFFEWPAQADFLKQTIRKVTSTYEVFIAPALYKTDENAQRENVKVTNVVWADFDGNAPDWEGFAGPPSLTIQSSIEGHNHVYWRLNSPLTDVEVIEDYNRRIAYNFQADGSGWDATQVLRPPTTLNHKRSAAVTVLSASDYSYDCALFESLGAAPAQLETSSWQLGQLPDPQTVILKYPFTPDLIALLGKDKSEIKDRSASLMNLAYGCCQYV